MKRRRNLNPDITVDSFTATRLLCSKLKNNNYDKQLEVREES